MLGVNYQYIYCSVKNCKYNEEHITRDGKTNKVVDKWYTCSKEKIQINMYGRCVHRPKER